MMTLLAYSLIPILSLADAPSKGFTSWQSALASKDSISAKVSIQTVGGTSTNFAIDLKKPNLVRLDTSTELVVADGTTITTFDKKGNIWYKRPQTKEDFSVLMGDEKYTLFSGFFGVTPKTVKTTDAGTRTLAAEQVLEIKAIMDKSAKVTQSFFVGQDGIAKRAALTAESKVKQGEKVQVITTASNVVVNGNSVPDLFAFKAPSNAKEIDYQDLIANKWFLDLDEAKLVASRTNKNIFIDFMASWCGPCKQMEREVFVTDEFKAMGKKLVFCKIDIDMNPALAEKYGVTAIPNMFVIRPDGSVVGSILGSMPLNAFMQELEKLTSSSK